MPLRRTQLLLGALLVAVQPRAVTSQPVEGRALWVNRFDYSSPDGIAVIMEKAARAHFNIIFFQARASADAYYRSEIEPCAIRLCGRLGGTPPYDPLEVAVREAHARGLQLHAWLNGFPGLNGGIDGPCRGLPRPDATSPHHVLMDHPEWQMVDRSGRRFHCPNSEEYIWLSPGYAEVRSQLARVAADVARRYQVDGIHLDRIRYPGTDWSYDPASLAAFGGDPAREPEAWRAFRRELVSRAVQETYDSITSVRPQLTLSAAVWAVYDDPWGWHTYRGFQDVLQDPREWARGGYLDVLVPMTYYRITPRYCARMDWACMLDDHLRAQRDTGHPVYIGIDAAFGVKEAFKQISLARARGAAGFSVYHYAEANAVGLFDALASGPFRDVARIPDAPTTRRAYGGRADSTNIAR